MIIVPFGLHPDDLAARLAPDRRLRRHALRVIRAVHVQIADWPAGATWVADGLVELTRGQLVGRQFRPDALGPDLFVRGPFVWVYLGVFPAMQ